LDETAFDEAALFALSRLTVPARRGLAFAVKGGDYLKVINPHGTQAGDLWAFSVSDRFEYSAVDHTRSFNSSILVEVGRALMSSKRRPMLRLVNDTSAGRHDMQLCPCSAEIYEQLGCTTYHRNCTDNLHEALSAASIDIPFTPAPLNIFMRVDVLPDGTLDRRLPESKPGSYALFRAEMDLNIALSACPQDITTINGPERTPRDLAVEILTAPETRQNG
jgi:uncharacterized protein YcgI (DUF1989 family)